MKQPWQYQYDTQKKTLEEIYFHTGNSGVTSRIVERRTVSESEEEREARLWADLDTEEYQNTYNGRASYKYVLEFMHGAMGHSSRSSTPILSRQHAEQYIEMLQSLIQHMDDTPDYKPLHTIKERDTIRMYRVHKGLRYEEVWSPEIITSQWSTSSRLLGHNLIDVNNKGVIVGFKAYDGPTPPTTGSDSCGNGHREPHYRYEDIGKPLEPVSNRERIIRAREMMKNSPNSQPAAKGDIDIHRASSTDRSI